jgi:glycosyltransferase involved in cell wall biosynthesis
MKILIISKSELCYNPRLLKSAEFLLNSGCEVDVFNPIININSGKMNDEIFNKFKFNEYSLDISKSSKKSYFTWLAVSLLHMFFVNCWRWFGVYNKYVLNKGLLFNKIDTTKSYDFIVINLVDNLAFAVELSKRFGCKVVFDSQEYFNGQYSIYEKWKLSWVRKSQLRYIAKCSIIVATTNVMKNQLNIDYNLAIPLFTLRNVPSKSMLPTMTMKNPEFFESDAALQLIWHGNTICFGNNRGLDLLIEAVSYCSCNCVLNIQGWITAGEMIKYHELVRTYKVEDRIFLRPSAKPLEIIESIKKYDVGLLGEIAEEENQLLTSSNKMFDYIHAGLPVIGPDLPGISETVKGLNTGLLYESGNAKNLAEKIDSLFFNKKLYSTISANNFSKAKTELTWEADFIPIFDEMIRQGHDK